MENAAICYIMTVQYIFHTWITKNGEKVNQKCHFDFFFEDKNVQFEHSHAILAAAILVIYNCCVAVTATALCRVSIFHFF